MVLEIEPFLGHKRYNFVGYKDMIFIYIFYIEGLIFLKKIKIEKKYSL